MVIDARLPKQQSSDLADGFLSFVELVCRYAVCAVFMVLAFASPTLAEKGKLRERLTPAVMTVVYPGAERLGTEEGSPPAIAVYQGGKIVAYVFSTLDIVAMLGYSATPFDVIAGVDLKGHITGAKVVFHNEPYILNDTRRERQLDSFLAREAGRPLRGGANLLPPDFVAGATVSARAMRAAVTASAKLVLRARGVGGMVSVPTLDADSFNPMSWSELVVNRRGRAPARDLGRGCGGARKGWRFRSDARCAARQA